MGRQLYWALFVCSFVCVFDLFGWPLVENDNGVRKVPGCNPDLALFSPSSRPRDLSFRRSETRPLESSERTTHGENIPALFSALTCKMYFAFNFWCDVPAFPSAQQGNSQVTNGISALLLLLPRASLQPIPHSSHSKSLLPRGFEQHIVSNSLLQEYHREKYWKKKFKTERVNEWKNPVWSSSLPSAWSPDRLPIRRRGWLELIKKPKRRLLRFT